MNETHSSLSSKLSMRQRPTNLACWPGHQRGPTFLVARRTVVQKCGALADAMQAQQACFCQDSIVAVLESSVGHGNVGSWSRRCWSIVFEAISSLIMDHRSIRSPLGVSQTTDVGHSFAALGFGASHACRSGLGGRSDLACLRHGHFELGPYLGCMSGLRLMHQICVQFGPLSPSTTFFPFLSLPIVLTTPALTGSQDPSLARHSILQV